MCHSHVLPLVPVKGQQKQGPPGFLLHLIHSSSSSPAVPHRDPYRTRTTLWCKGRCSRAGLLPLRTSHCKEGLHPEGCVAILLGLHNHILLTCTIHQTAVWWRTTTAKTRGAPGGSGCSGGCAEAVHSRCRLLPPLQNLPLPPRKNDSGNANYKFIETRVRADCTARRYSWDYWLQMHPTHPRREKEAGRKRGGDVEETTSK